MSIEYSDSTALRNMLMKLRAKTEGFASPLCLRQIHPQVLEEGDMQIYTPHTVQAEVPMTVKVI